MWKHLVETGFLGTDRKQLQKDQLPEELVNALNKLSEDDKENYFLNTLAFAQYFNESGELPKKFDGEIESNFIEEEREEISHEMFLLFSRINNLDTSFVKVKLVDQWIDTIIHNDQIVNFALFKDLIEYGKNKSKEVRGKIAKILSNNALRAAVEFNHIKEDYIPKTMNDDAWYTGKIADRKAYLEELIIIDAPKALSLLQETWGQETMINKISFLKIIFENPKKEFLPFISLLYNSEYAYQEAEKEKQREGRNLLAKILLMFPTSTLCQETLEQLVPFFTKRALISKLKYKLNFPLEQTESFWNEKSMLQKYGLDTEGFSPFFHAIREEDWMAYFIRFIPLRAFADALKGTEEDVFACLFDGKELQRKDKRSDTVQPMFFNELLAKAKESKTAVSKSLAQSFITRSKKNKSKYDFRDLVFFTETEDCEALIKENKIFRTAMSIISSYAWEISNHQFSLELSKVFLQKLHSKHDEWVYMAGADKLGLVLSTDVLEEIENLTEKVNKMKFTNFLEQNTEEEHRSNWKNKIYIPIKEVIEIRKQLEVERLQKEEVLVEMDES